eukprot:768399-Hanusia_phi.AAC.5
MRGSVKINSVFITLTPTVGHASKGEERFAHGGSDAGNEERTKGGQGEDKDGRGQEEVMESRDHFMRSLKVDISASGRIRTRKPKPKVKKEEIYSLTDDKQEADKKSLTLAQKLGLVPAPPSKLTREEWMSVAEKSRKDIET